MINFQLVHFLGALRTLEALTAECAMKNASGIPEGLITDEDRARLIERLRDVVSNCRRLDLPTAETRIRRISAWFSGPVSYSALGDELKILRQAVDDDVRNEYFYHYPRELASFPIATVVHWKQTLDSFPSTEVKFEITSGADCYALGHPTAAIFHFMRVAEIGLRAIAKKLRVRLPKGKPVAWSEWGNVIDAIDGKVRAAKQMTRGPKKAAELDFYSGLLGSLQGFKDMFRDNVMHYRREYKAPEAETAMRYVRDFMNKLSTRVSG